MSNHSSAARVRMARPELTARIGILFAGLSLGALVLFPAVAGAAVPSTPASTYGTDGDVNAVATLGDTVYLGGSFSNVGLQTGAGAATAASDGQADPAMPGVRGGAHRVNAVVADGSGGFYIGGDFTQVGGIARNNIAHILADKSVDPSFDPNADGPVNALALSGSTLYVGGEFSGPNSIGGASRSRIAALDTTTGNATSWDPNATNAGLVSVAALAVSGSTVYVGGLFNSIGGQTRHDIAGIDTTTGNATSFDPNASGTVRALAVDGPTVYAGGNFSGTSSIGGADRNFIAALNSTTGTATSWDPNANSGVFALAVDGSTVYAGGGFTSIGGQTRNRIAALDANTDTNNATSWDPDSQGFVNALAVDGSTVYAAGSFSGPSSIGGADRNRLAALDSTTGDANPWDPNASGQAFALAIDGSTVYAGGQFLLINQVPRSNLAALDMSTGQPTDWDPSANGTVDALASYDSLNTIYAGGSFASVGGQVRNNIAALDATTGDASSWDPDANDTVRTLLRTGSVLYAGGDFNGASSIGGADRNYAAALMTNADTDNATTWNPNANGPVRALATSDDFSTVYAGGDFSGASSIGGQARNHIAALSASTGNAFNWNPNANDVVRALALSGSTLYAGGDFNGASSIGGADRNHIAALDGNANTNGNATDWDPDANDTVDALAIDGSTVYAGGVFSSIGGAGRASLAALDANTNTNNATSWDPGANATVNALTVASGEVYAGGVFDGLASGLASHFAAFVEAPANTVVPSISGAPSVGEELTCDNGTWSGATPQAYSYEWLRNNTPIAGETNQTYRARQADIDQAIKCRVTATNLGGSSTATSDPVQISVRLAERIFWANFGGNSISYADLDGSGHGEDLDTGATTVTNPLGTAIDAANGRVYWVDSGNAIKFANLDGSGGGGTLNTSGANVAAIRGMVLDSAAGRVYWASEGGDKIAFANLDGSGGGNLNTTGATVDGPAGVAVDQGAGRIYWANDNDDAHPISSAKLDGSGDGSDLDTTGATASRATAPTLDVAGGKVYWTNKDNNTISDANLDGSGGGQLDTTGTTLAGPFGTALDTAAGQLYAVSFNGAISQVGLGGGGSDLDTTGATVSNPSFPSLLEQPDNTALPTVSGTPAAGHNLSCSNGTWAGDNVGELLYRAPEGFAYEWFKDNVAISGQTGSTYMVQAGDTGHQIRCRVTAENFGGTTNATSAQTTIKTKPANTAVPSISGTPVSGKTLTCNKGTWTGSAPITYSYAWLRNNVAIAGAASATYVVKAADIGKQLRCRVTASNDAGSTMATSAATTIKTPPKNTVAPKIIGTPKVGKTLTCSKGTWTGTAPITYKYQWLRNGGPIAGATKATYVAKAADKNKFLSCKVTATNAAGQATKTSAAVKVA